MVIICKHNKKSFETQGVQSEGRVCAMGERCRAEGQEGDVSSGNLHLTQESWEGARCREVIRLTTQSDFS